jgi:hypothetical protein
VRESSSIDFIVPPSPSPSQVLGTFTHVNFTIPTGTAITSINLGLTADIYMDDVWLGTRSFQYNFEHFETVNDEVPCANGGPNGVGINAAGCADRVTINWLESSDSFNIDGDVYTLNISGFSSTPDGLNPFFEFWTAENQQNPAFLVANVTLRNQLTEIPEPGTLALLGIGLAGLGVSRLRRALRR